MDCTSWRHENLCGWNNLPLGRASDLTHAVILTPQNREELLAQLAANSAEGGKIEKVDLSGLATLVEHSPEDMTASVEGGMTVTAFKERLRESGQWLPIDPPGADSVTIGDLLAYDLSGPRRLGYGTIRDYLIGIRVALADGTLIKAGGKVVKNVAGYDLCKLFIGARHTLGIIVEGTFKLRPLPEQETFLQAEVASLEELEIVRGRLLATRANPIVFDAHNLSGKILVIAGFAGNREDVESEVKLAGGIGMRPMECEEYAGRLLKSGGVNKLSVLPTRVIDTLKNIAAEKWLAHLGSGVIYHLGGNQLPEETMPVKLMSRVKQAYDPKRIFPDYTV